MLSVILKSLKYTPALLVGVGVCLCVISLVALFPNRELIGLVWFDGSVAVSTKAGLLLSLYGSLFSNHTWFSSAVAIATALLAGINATLMAYYIKTVSVAKISKRASLASIGGMVAGLFGIGCAACGSILLTAILAGIGSTALLLLPFDGAEIGVLGIALLLYAVKKLVTEIKKGPVCSSF